MKITKPKKMCTPRAMPMNSGQNGKWMAEARHDKKNHGDQVHPVRNDGTAADALRDNVRDGPSYFTPQGLVTVSKLLPVFGSTMCTAQAVQGSKL